ncbi:hypothetical protein SKAU_G00423810 [Synaphobranchus kaupii]|uniref:Uncharacterized protein n=1 Tax=Synaphobranchus kaupii TaxID=118154 RepID=A0A9Q1E5G9_SYNKA|nr:hypothetical protein SKAU_G00423810 [Synaphobranchus kaupii]
MFGTDSATHPSGHRLDRTGIKQTPGRRHPRLPHRPGNEGSAVVENVGPGVSKFSKGWKSVESVPRRVDDYMKKKLNVDEFVTHNLPLEKINEAFDLMTSGKSIRTVIKMAPVGEAERQLPLHAPPLAPT